MLYLAPVAWILILLLVEDAVPEPESALGGVLLVSVLFGPLAVLLLALVGFRMYLARKARLSVRERASAEARSLLLPLGAQIEAERMAEAIERDELAAADPPERKSHE